VDDREQQQGITDLSSRESRRSIFMADPDGSADGGALS